MNLRENMVAAHRERADRAVTELNQAAEAPALFKPEWSERAMSDLQTAQREIARWS